MDEASVKALMTRMAKSLNPDTKPNQFRMWSLFLSSENRRRKKKRNAEIPSLLTCMFCDREERLKKDGEVCARYACVGNCQTRLTKKHEAIHCRLILRACADPTFSMAANVFISCKASCPGQV